MKAERPEWIYHLYCNLNTKNFEVTINHYKVSGMEKDKFLLEDKCDFGNELPIRELNKFGGGLYNDKPHRDEIPGAYIDESFMLFDMYTDNMAKGKALFLEHIKIQLDSLNTLSESLNNCFSNLKTKFYEQQS